MIASLCENLRLMSWWRPKDDIQLVTARHPTWLCGVNLCLFLFCEDPKTVSCPESRNISALGWTQRARGHRICIIMPFRAPDSFTSGVRHHCLVVCAWSYLHDCMWMSVWKCGSHDHMTIYRQQEGWAGGRVDGWMCDGWIYRKQVTQRDLNLASLWTLYDAPSTRILFIFRYKIVSRTCTQGC